jgi:hypothetical protein
MKAERARRSAGVPEKSFINSLARTYFEQLEAPVKGFYSFRNSAHSPVFEEPGRAQRIVREDILRGTTTLADDA